MTPIALLAWSYPPRLAAAALGLAVVLVVRDAGFSYAAAGLVSGAWTIGTAVTAPYLGRLSDRLGPSPVLATRAIASAAPFVSLALLANHLPLVALTAIAFLGGAGTPSLGGTVRALLARTVDAPQTQRLFTADAAAQEINFAVGPLLVTALVALASPRVALVTIALLLGGGSLALAIAARRAPRAEPGSNDGPAPHRYVRFRRLLATCFLYGMVFGAVEISVPAAYDLHGIRDRAGLALAAWSAGSGLGGLLAARRSLGSPDRLLSRALLISTMLALGPTAAADQPVALAVMLLLLGTTHAPAIGSVYSLVPGAVAHARLSEAFSLVTSALIGGVGAGAAVSGVVVSSFGPRPGFAAAVAAALTAWIVAKKA